MTDAASTASATKQATDPAMCPCGHPNAGHDHIAARFCQATIAGDLQRACVCFAATAPPGTRPGHAPASYRAG